MELAPLNRDRLLYALKQGQTVLGAGDSLSYSQQNALGSTTTNVYPPATAVAPGTQIFSAVWSTSASDNRITLTPNDRLTVYENGAIQMLLNSDGLTFGKSGLNIYDTGVSVEYNGVAGLYMKMGNGTFESDSGNQIGPGLYLNEDVATGTFFDGVFIANHYRGKVSSAGVKLAGTGGYLVTHPATGQYLVTFTNPDLAITDANFSAVATATDGHFRCKITFPAINQILFDYQQSDYSGGLYTGESAVDTGFCFIASRATI